MTDKTKYSNISVNKKTYADLQRLSKEILPGETPISNFNTLNKDGFVEGFNEIPITFAPNK